MDRAKMDREMMLSQQLVDLSQRIPIPPLPLELFIGIVSLLDPFMIAICHLVCKSWRLSILLHSVLYWELDLSRLGFGVAPRIRRSIPNYFIHLSSRAHDRLVKVSLNMMFFWKSYISKRKVYEDSFAFEFFGSLLFRSRETLREISLKFELDGAGFRDFHSSFFPLLTATLEQLKSYPLLNSIYIEGPTGISFTIGSDRVNLKAFQVEDNREDLQNCADHAGYRDGMDEEERERYSTPKITFALVAPIAVYGKEFIGDPACFSRFEASEYWYESYWEPTSSLNLLSGSFSSLKTFVLDPYATPMIGGSILWDFVIQCINLESLSIPLDRRVRPGEIISVELEPPKELTTSSGLKSFNLRSHGGYSIDWDLTSPWLGSNVTEMNLSDGKDEYGDYQLMKDPSDLLSIFHSITRTLTKLSLSGLHPRVETGGATTVKMLEPLPKLRELELENLHSTFLDFFTTSLVYPDLQVLSVSYDDSKQSPAECFLALLKANSSNLVKIKFSYFSYIRFLPDAPELPCQSLDLNFDKLSVLNVGRKEGALWFASLSKRFPRLSTLDTGIYFYNSVHEAFRSKAPQLLSYTPHKHLEEHS